MYFRDVNRAKISGPALNVFVQIGLSDIFNVYASFLSKTFHTPPMHEEYSVLY